MSEVVFRVDEESEVLSLVVNGKELMLGNFWDFDFERDCGILLDELGIKNSSESFVYNNEED